MKGKLFILIIVAVAIIGIYFTVKRPSVEAPTDQKNTIQSSSSANSTSNGMEKMSNEEMMNHGQPSSGEKIVKHTVFYTDKGFSPSSLEIKAGETVQFVNNSSGGMWVASAPHPEHTAYPEFDAKKNIPAGEIYEFTFTKNGEWKYHNHTKTEAYGTIIVSTANQKVSGGAMCRYIKTSYGYKKICYFT